MSAEKSESDEDRLRRETLERLDAQAKVTLSPFDRLPPEVQASTREHQRRQDIQGVKYQERLNKRLLKGVIGGAFVAALMALPTGTHPLFLAMMFVAGGATAGATVAWRLSYLSGMALYGAGTIGVVILCYGMIRPDPFTLILSWLFFIGAGCAIASWAEGDRNANDAF